MVKTARAIIIEDNKLLVFFRRKIVDGIEKIYYAIPGGHVEDGETCEGAVIRELKEEMNIDIELIEYLGNLIIDNDKEENYYYAKILGGELKLSGEELDRNCSDNYYEIRWLPISELDNSGIRSIKFIKRVLENEN